MMKKLTTFLLLGLIGFASGCTMQNASTDIHKYRPELHYTPQENWMNDPNGMFYDEGLYHLYYQYNPYGDRWGHMSWGHATSKDLVQWEQHPVALLEENGVMIFSGSMVVDRDNTSGFGTDEAYPIVAIYTGHEESGDSVIQHQDIAYSLDGGYTFKKYEGNPVLDLSLKDFRDPKVFWHEETEKWVMVVALSADYQLHFYGSDNLIDWEFLSEFGPMGAANGLWECPDLFELPIDGDPNNTKWVLQVDLGTNSANPGSGGQYFVGDFDGTTFITDENYDYPLWVDHGHDFYAAVSWFNWDKSMPTQWLSWANNWNYAQDIPTNGWRSMMSFARNLELKMVNNKPILYQPLVDTYQAYRDQTMTVENQPVETEYRFEESAQEMIQSGIFEVEFMPETDGESKYKLLLDDGIGGTFSFEVDESESTVTVVRTESDAGFEGEIFENPQVLTLDEGVTIESIHLLFDKSIIEVFINGGLYTFTNQMFVDNSNLEFTLSKQAGDLSIKEAQFWNLKSAL